METGEGDGMKRILTSLAIALLVPVGFWLWGYDFDTRGDAAAGTYILTVGAFLITWFFPWND